MPKLVLFVACENVIISDSNNLSIINVLQELVFGIAPNVELPPSASIPMRWFALTAWRKQQSDAGKIFEQRFRLQFPDRSIAFETPIAEMDFKKDTHRSISDVRHFPIAQVGDFELVALLREKGKTPWDEVATYSIRVGRDNSLGEPRSPVPS